MHVKYKHGRKDNSYGGKRKYSWDLTKTNKLEEKEADKYLLLKIARGDEVLISRLLTIILQ